VVQAGFVALAIVTLTAALPEWVNAARARGRRDARGAPFRTGPPEA
jgi:hypothetical protein